MRIPLARTATAVATAAFAVALPATAGTVTGTITIDGCAFTPSHVTALPTEDGPLLVFTDRALDIDLGYEFDPRQSALEALTLEEPRADNGLMVALPGGILNHFYWCGDPESGSTTQTSGHAGDATVALEEPSGLAGRWTLAAAKEGGDAWDLTWSAELADPAAGASPLSAGGGEPGAAYLAFLDDLREGDVDDIRGFLNNPYFFRAEADAEEIAEDLASLRESMPASASVTGGRADTAAAILDVEGSWPDGTPTTQRVLLRVVDGRWVFGGFETGD